MDRLWTPWRYAYVTGADQALRNACNPQRKDSSGCIFCEMQAETGGTGEKSREESDREHWIVSRGEHCFICLNAYPYTSGHVLVVPYSHLDELQKLPAAEAQEMMLLAQRLETALRQLYKPDGLNLGMNIGAAGGAGVAGHIHLHVLPRWVADANFMTVVGETRVLPELLDVTWERLHKVLNP